MKNKKTNKKNLRDLFAYGGVAMDIETPSEVLAQIQNMTQEAMLGAMSDSTVAGLRGMGNMMTNIGMSMASQGVAKSGGGSSKFGQFLSKNMGTINSLVGAAQTASSFATGGVTGKVPINAEGGEVIESPFGIPMELAGPSHASGGIDMEVPQGTEVYSKRLKGEDGKSMADRKKKREKELSKIQKLLEKDPTNVTLKKTLQKIQANNEMLDQKDLSQMQFVKDLVGSVEAPREEYKLGSVVGGNPIPGYNKKNIFYPNIFMDPELMDKISNIGALDTNVGTKFKIDPNIEEKLIGANAKINFNNSEDGVVPIDFGENVPDNNYYFNKATGSKGKFGMYQQVDDNDNPIGSPVKSTSNTENSKFSLDKYLGGITTGDLIGMGANLFGPLSQMKNTVANRNATPPEQNAFKNYGDQALKKIQSQYGLLDDVRDNQLQNAELSRQGTIARNNNSARGLNTQRALNLATDSSMNELKANIFAQYAQQAMGISAQEAAQMAQNDQMRMQGEDRRAERELQNTDNFFSNMAKNISDKYRGIGETGKALNQTKQREAVNEILKGLNPNFEYDPNTGKLIAKKTETLETEKAKEADVKREGVAKETSLFTKDGKPTAKFIKDYEENPEKYNYKNSKGKRATADEIADVLYRQSKNKYVQDLEELDTTYKTKSIDGKKFTNNLDYKKALDAGRTDIRDWNTFKGTPTIGKYKGKQLSSEVVNKIENILQEHNLNVDTSDTKSVKALQKILGISQTGNFGDKTIEALLKK